MEDGASYFFGVDGVHMLGAAGTVIRRNGWYQPTDVYLVSLRRSIRDTIATTRLRVETLLKEGISSGVLDPEIADGVGETCSQLPHPSGHLRLEVRFGGVERTWSACYGPDTPKKVQEFVSRLVATYEYPEHVKRAPRFVRDPNVLMRYAIGWEDGVGPKICERGVEEIVLLFYRDGEASFSGKKYPWLKRGPSSDTGVLLEPKQELALLLNRVRSSIGQLQNFGESATERQLQAYAHSFDTPFRVTSWHVKDESGKIIDLSSNIRRWHSLQHFPDEFKALQAIGERAKAAIVDKSSDALDAKCRPASQNLMRK